MIRLIAITIAITLVLLMNMWWTYIFCLRGLFIKGPFSKPFLTAEHFRGRNWVSALSWGWIREKRHLIVFCKPSSTTDFASIFTSYAPETSQAELEVAQEKLKAGQVRHSLHGFRSVAFGENLMFYLSQPQPFKCLVEVGYLLSDWWGEKNIRRYNW
jgi:hypothetical protein